MGLKGYRLWVMGQLDSTCSAPPYSPPPSPPLPSSHPPTPGEEPPPSATPSDSPGDAILPSPGEENLGDPPGSSGCKMPFSTSRACCCSIRSSKR
jgi:hypothetical protein